MQRSLIGGLLALSIICAWLVLHIYSVFFLSLAGPQIAMATAVVLTLCWLNVGLFIIAHDAMHGSLFAGRPGLNRLAGRIALGLYAGFSFDRLKTSHLEHHRYPGSADDPDFDADHPNRFWPWYSRFMRRYFGLSEFLVLCVPVSIYLLLGVHIANLLIFWALPAALSSLQLFAFGTYLPHRQDGRGFADEHNARTNELGWLPSLITCFHFGYHHEHHLAPHVPWWGLPTERKRRALARSGPQPVRRPRRA